MSSTHRRFRHLPTLAGIAALALVSSTQPVYAALPILDVTATPGTSLPSGGTIQFSGSNCQQWEAADPAATSLVDVFALFNGVDSYFPLEAPSSGTWSHLPIGMSDGVFVASFDDCAVALSDPTQSQRYRTLLVEVGITPLPAAVTVDTTSITVSGTGCGAGVGVIVTGWDTAIGDYTLFSGDGEAEADASGAWTITGAATITSPQLIYAQCGDTWFKATVGPVAPTTTTALPTTTGPRHLPKTGQASSSVALVAAALTTIGALLFLVRRRPVVRR